MKRTPRSRQKLMLTVLGTAIIVPLIAAPASAALDGGRFIIHAENISSPEYQAYAGIQGLAGGGGGNGGGGSQPGEEEVDPDSSAVLASYSCGAVSFKVTQDMVDFSKANERIFSGEESGELQTHAQGWQSISHRDADFNYKLGFPEDGSSPTIVMLSSSMSIPVLDREAPVGAIATVSNQATSCKIMDLRKTPKAGGYFSYSLAQSTDPNDSSKGSYAEGRYVTLEDGSVAAARFMKQTNGTQVASRKVSGSSAENARSAIQPYDVQKPTTGVVTLRLALKDTSAGYDHIFFEQNANGSGRVAYSTITSTDPTNGSFRTGAATRTDGPVQLKWTTDGSMEWADSASGVRYYSIEEYNDGTGQNWDGSFPKLSDFDSEISFTF